MGGGRKPPHHKPVSDSCESLTELVRKKAMQLLRPQMADIQLCSALKPISLGAAVSEGGSAGLKSFFGMCGENPARGEPSSQGTLYLELKRVSRKDL